MNGFLQGDMVAPEAEAAGSFGSMPCPFAASTTEQLVVEALALIGG